MTITSIVSKSTSEFRALSPALPFYPTNLQDLHFGLPKFDDRYLLAPLGAAVAPPHASRTLSRPSKKRSERKIESSKFLKDLNQNSSPDYVLQIQDLQKRAPMDLINFPEGSLRPSWGAPPHFWSPPWTLLESHWGHSKKTNVFLDIH